MVEETTPPVSRWQRLRDFFLRPSSLSLAAVVAIGMVSGLLFWGAFNTGMEATNSLDFCTSCHEMRDTVYQEYKETIHYKNRSGVRAACPDCHVPKDWTHKFVRKVQASQELYTKFIRPGSTPGEIRSQAHGTRDARMEDDEGKRFARMPQLPFLGCHGPRQAASAGAGKHGQAQKEGKTCIDCHKGIAHLLPKEYVEPDE